MANTISRSLGIAVYLTAASVTASYAEQCSLSNLGWMVGEWKNTADPQGAQERWVLAPQNVLMGSAWEFPQGKARYAEIMTVKLQGDTISMVLRHFDGGLSRAWEDRDKPMLFTATDCSRDSVVFDGQGDHAGEHLTYRRSRNSLLIIGDFIHHGTPDHEEWHMTRAAD